MVYFMMLDIYLFVYTREHNAACGDTQVTIIIVDRWIANCLTSLLLAPRKIHANLTPACDLVRLRQNTTRYDWITGIENVLMYLWQQCAFC